MAETVTGLDTGEVEESCKMLMLLKTGIFACVLTGLYVLPLIYLCRRMRYNWIDYCLAVFVVLVPPILLFLAIGLITADVPFWDDYDAIMRYVCLPTIKRMKHLFDLHNQHRIVMVRLFLEGMVAFGGKVNFKACMFCGTAQLLVVFACFCFFYIRQFGRNSLFLLSACSWLLFSLHNFENAFWALTAMQNFGVIMWAFLAITLFHFRSCRGCCLAAWGCAITAVFTSIQGMAVLIIFTIMLFLPPHGTSEQAETFKWGELVKFFFRRIKSLRYGSSILGCLILTGICSYLYLRGYNPGDVELRSAMASILDKALYVVAFLGNPVMLLPLAIPVGCVVIAAFVFIVINFPRLPKLMRPLFFFSLFLLSCDVAGVNFRAESPYAGLCYRYYVIVACLYSSFIGLLLSLIRTNSKRQCRLELSILCLCSVLCVSYSLLFWKQLEERSEAIRINLLTWPQMKEGLRYDEARLDEASNALEQMEEKGLYDHITVHRKGEALPKTTVPWAELHFP